MLKSSTRTNGQAIAIKAARGGASNPNLGRRFAFLLIERGLARIGASAEHL